MSFRIFARNCAANNGGFGIDPLIENGPIEYYDNKGNLIITGKYCHGEMCGKWKFDNYPTKNFSKEVDYNFNPLNLNIRKEIDTLSQEVPTGIDERFPDFPGGDIQLRKYIKDNMIKPYSAVRGNISGICIVKYVINEDGNVENIQVVKSLNKDCDKEALRLIKEMPKWIPGIHNGKKAKVTFTNPINF